MKIISINSQSNALLKKVRALQDRHAREKTGLFLLEGYRPVEEALLRGLKLDRVLVSNRYFNQDAEALTRLNLAEVSVVEDQVFQQLHGTSSSCGIIALAAVPEARVEQVFSSPRPVVVVCDQLQDPGNLGTIIRSAFAADAGGILLTRGSVDPWNAKVVRSAAGALFDMPVLYDLTPGDCTALLEQREVAIFVCEAAGKTLYCNADLTGPVALVFGNEARGVCGEFLRRASDTLSIPMRPGSESLNVGVSAGIILCESYRQRLAQNVAS